MEPQQPQEEPVVEQSVKPLFYPISFCLALIGAAISYYMTQHFLQVKFAGASDAFCNINSFINCDDVARSRFAELFNIPLGVFGSGYFLGVMILLFVAYKFDNYAKDSLITLKAMAIVGSLVSIALGIISVTLVKAVCINCIATYLLTFALLALVYVYRTYLPPSFNITSLNNGSIYPIMGLAIAILAYQVFKPTSRDFKMDLPQTKFERRQADENLLLAPNASEIKIYTSPFASYGEDYRKGGDSAKVQLVEFSDFQCPACQQASQVVERLSEEFGDALQVVFKNFPLDDKCNPKVQKKFHDYACDAAVLARCAGRNGRFWDFYKITFENQAQLSTENLRKWAQQVGLNEEQINDCMHSKDILEKIKSDVEAGDKAGVEGTPTLFLNGKKVLDWHGEESLSHKIRQLIAE